MVQLDAATETLKLLADPTRLQIVWALLHGEHSVNELADHVGAAPAVVARTSPSCAPPTWSAPAATATVSSTPPATNTSKRLATEALLHADHLVAGGRPPPRVRHQAS